MASKDNNEHLEHHSAFMDYKIKRKKWADNAVDCWKEDSDKDQDLLTSAEQLHGYNRGQGQHEDKSQEDIPKLVTQDSGYGTYTSEVGGHSKIARDDIQEAKSNDTTKSDQGYDSGICSESGSSRSVSRSGATSVCNNSPLSMCMSPSTNSISPGLASSSDDGSMGGNNGYYKHSLEPVHEITTQVNDEETRPESHEFNGQNMDSEYKIKSGNGDDDSEENSAVNCQWEEPPRLQAESMDRSVNMDQRSPLEVPSIVPSNNTESSQQQEPTDSPMLLTNNDNAFSNIKDGVSSETYTEQNQNNDADNNKDNVNFGIDMPKMAVTIETPNGPQTVCFPILERHPQTYSFLTNRENEENDSCSDKVIDLSAEKNGENGDSNVNTQQHGSEHDVGINTSTAIGDKSGNCNESGNNNNEQNVHLIDQQHSSLLNNNEKQLDSSNNNFNMPQLMRNQCSDGNVEINTIQQHQDIVNRSLENNNMDGDYAGCRPLMSWEKFSEVAGISVDLTKKTINPLMDGFGLDGMSMMMGRLPSVDPKDNDPDNSNSHRTDWDQLSRIQKAQIDQINVSKKEAEEMECENSMICEVCNDRATGLHYGVVSCEGCKGFFKRSVQNRRVYVCIGSGQCEINKVKRNRCQFCRFNKCLNKGMIMAAVREDRMPGGRNSGAVYNLYKLKYRRHKSKTKSCDSSTTSSYTSDSTLTSDSDCSQSVKRYTYTPEKAQRIDEMGEPNGAVLSPTTKEVVKEISKEIVAESEKSINNMLKLASSNPLVNCSNSDVQAINESFNKVNASQMVLPNRRGLTYPFPRKMRGPRDLAPIEIGGRRLRFGCHSNVQHSVPQSPVMDGYNSTQSSHTASSYNNSKSVVAHEAQILASMEGSSLNHSTEVVSAHSYLVKDSNNQYGSVVKVSPDKPLYYNNGGGRYNGDSLNVSQENRPAELSPNHRQLETAQNHHRISKGMYFDPSNGAPQQHKRHGSSSSESSHQPVDLKHSIDRPMQYMNSYMYSPSSHSNVSVPYRRSLSESGSMTNNKASLEMKFLQEREGYSGEQLSSYLSGRMSKETYSAQASNHSRTYVVNSTEKSGHTQLVVPQVLSNKYSSSAEPSNLSIRNGMSTGGYQFSDGAHTPLVVPQVPSSKNSSVESPSNISSRNGTTVGYQYPTVSKGLPSIPDTYYQPSRDKVEYSSSSTEYRALPPNMYTWPGATILTSMAAGFEKQNRNRFSCGVPNSSVGMTTTRFAPNNGAVFPQRQEVPFSSYSSHSHSSAAQSSVVESPSSNVASPPLSPNQRNEHNKQRMVPSERAREQHYERNQPSFTEKVQDKNSDERRFTNVVASPPHHHHHAFVSVSGYTPTDSLISRSSYDNGASASVRSNNVIVSGSQNSNNREVYSRQESVPPDPYMVLKHKQEPSVGISHHQPQQAVNVNNLNSSYYKLIEEMSVGIRDGQKYPQSFNAQSVISHYLTPSAEDLKYQQQRTAILSQKVPTMQISPNSSSFSHGLPTDRLVPQSKQISVDSDNNSDGDLESNKKEPLNSKEQYQNKAGLSNSGNVYIETESSYSNDGSDKITEVQDSNQDDGSNKMQYSHYTDSENHHIGGRFSSVNNTAESYNNKNTEQYTSHHSYNISTEDKKDDDQLSTISASSTSSHDSKSTMLLIQQLMNWEDFDSGLTKQQLPTEESQSLSDIYAKLGDEIMCEIVRWMKKLPFYCLISLSAHTETLEKHWHHVLLLAISVNQAWSQIHKQNGKHLDSQQYLVTNLQILHSYLTVKLGHCIKFEDFFSESGEVVEKITKLICQFAEIGITREEYVVLKVLLLLHSDSRVMDKVRHCYIMALKEYLQEKCPDDPDRFSKLMQLKTAVEDCGDSLMEQKMIHVPFLLN